MSFKWHAFAAMCLMASSALASDVVVVKTSYSDPSPDEFLQSHLSNVIYTTDRLYSYQWPCYDTNPPPHNPVWNFSGTPGLGSPGGRCFDTSDDALNGAARALRAQADQLMAIANPTLLAEGRLRYTFVFEKVPGYTNYVSLRVGYSDYSDKDIGAGSCHAPSPPQRGNPVTLGSGNKYQREVDYVSASGLEFARHYNSGAEAYFDSPNWNGWTHTYSRKFIPAPD